MNSLNSVATANVLSTARETPAHPPVKPEHLIRVGEVARRLGMRHVMRVVTPQSNVRVSLTHYVPAEDMANFRRILEWIGQRRRIVTPQEFLQSYADPPGAAFHGALHLVTFDDGLMSSFHAAQRVLNPLGIKAIFFVPTQILELGAARDMREFALERVYRRTSANSITEEQYRTMGATELQTLHSQGHTILPHTYSHAHLSELTTEADVERELRRPKEVLEELLGVPAAGFAFPVGTERVVTRFAYEHVRAIYSYCFLGLSGANTKATNRAYICRDCIHPFHPLRHVENVLDGVFDPYYRIKLGRLRAHAGAGAGE